MSGSVIPSYPKVYALGHPALEGLLDGPVVVQEKVDGSQFSFGTYERLGPVVQMRSKGAVVYPETDDKLFRPAADTVTGLLENLLIDHTYRGEVIAKPKHNTLTYSRVPKGNVILFDVERPDGTFFNIDELPSEALRLGLEAVPSFEVEALDGTAVANLLQRTSVLGGSLIEGVVVKNHHRWGKDGKFLAGKYVSEAFKETHKKAWSGENPKGQDVIETLIHELASPARYVKAVQHLRERGELEGDPRDIGKLLNEAKSDIASEEKEYIAEKLLQWAMPKVLRGAVGGLPQWYKEQLLERQFEESV